MCYYCYYLFHRYLEPRAPATGTTEHVMVVSGDVGLPHPTSPLTYQTYLLYYTIICYVRLSYAYIHQISNGVRVCVCV